MLITSSHCVFILCVFQTTDVYLLSFYNKVAKVSSKKNPSIPDSKEHNYSARILQIGTFEPQRVPTPGPNRATDPHPLNPQSVAGRASVHNATWPGPLASANFHTFKPLSYP